MGEREAAFRCACHTECIVATYLEDNDGGPVQVELGFWKMGQDRKYRLRDRLRHIWRIVRLGTPYEDWIILDRTEARRMSAWLLGATANGGPDIITWKFDPGANTGDGHTLRASTTDEEGS